MSEDSGASVSSSASSSSSSSRRADSPGSEKASSSAATSSGSFSPAAGGEASGERLRAPPGSLTCTLIGPLRAGGGTALALGAEAGGASIISPNRSSDVRRSGADPSSPLGGGAAVLSLRRLVITGPQGHEIPGLGRQEAG